MTAYLSLLSLVSLVLFVHVVVRNFRFGASSDAIATYADRPLQTQDLQKADNRFILLRAHLENWYVVLFQAIISLLLISTPAGRDVVNYLVDTVTGHWFWIILNFILIIGAIYLYSAAIWVIPWYLMDYPDQARFRHNVIHLSILRVLALTTYGILGVAIVAADNAGSEHFSPGMYLLIILGMYVLPYVLNFFLTPENSPSFFRHWSVWYWVVLAVLTFAGCWMLKHEIWLKSFMLAGCYAFAWVFWLLTKPLGAAEDDCMNKLFVSLDNWSNRIIQGIFPGKKPELPHRELALRPDSDRIKRNRLYYRFLTGSSFIWAMICTFAPNLMPVPPLVVLFSGLGFLLLLIDYLSNSSQRMLKQKTAYDVDYNVKPDSVARWMRNNERPLFLVLIFTGLLLVFSGESSKAVLHPLSITEPVPEKISMHSYLDDWMRARYEKIRTAPDSIWPVFIFAGQGGGSRAGYWFSAALTGLETRWNGDLREHTLALSTVSGSSPGALAALAWWEHPENTRPAYTTYCAGIYRRNFVSSAISGNLYGDFFKKIWTCLPDTWIKNRNTRLQEEESFSIDRALNADSSNITMFRSLTRPYNRSNLIQYARQPFSDLYYLKFELQTDLPLALFNSTHVQSGRRTIVNPVIDFSDSTTFVNVVDLCKRLYCPDCCQQRKCDLSAGQAANLSELFPWVSAGAHIPGLGGYVDGGYYENYGLTTALEVYREAEKWLEQQQDSVLSRKIRFYMVGVINDVPAFEENGETADNIDLDSAMPGQIAVPLVTALNTPFSGHAETARKRTQKALGTRYIELKITKNSLPLTRILTEKNIRDMQSNMDSTLTQLVQDTHSPFYQK